MLPGLVKSALFSPFRLALKLAFWGLLLLFVVGFVFVLTFDLNDYKPMVEGKVSALLKQELRINGDVKIGFDPMPSVVLHDIQLGNAAAERVEITIPFDSSSFRSFAQIDDLRIGERKIGDYDLPIVVTPQGFEIPKAEGELDGAGLSGSASYLNEKMLIDLNVEDLDYAYIAPGVTGGDVKMVLKLQGAGRGDGLISSLNGRAFVAGEKGKMAGNALQFWTGDLISSLLMGRKDSTEINCAIGDFVVENGVAKSRTIIIDIDDATIFGRGTVDFVRQHVDLIFTPRPKSASLMSLAASVRVHGAFGNIKTTPESMAVAKKLGGLLLGAMNPAMAVLPMMERGTGVDNPCLKYAAEK